MNIRLEQYRIFCMAARCGSFSEAARNLYMTQSAISQQIKLLEDSLGATLFVRARSGIKLTGQGKFLLEYAESALSLISSAEEKFQKMGNLEEGELVIGSGDTISRHYLLPVLEKFHESHPGIKVSIVNRVTGETLKKIKSGIVELAFVNLPLDEGQDSQVFDIQRLATLHDVFAAGEKYSRFKGRVVTFRDLANESLVMLEPKSNSRRAVDAYLIGQGINLKPEIELGSHDLVLEFAASNMGIACVTEEFSRLYLDSGRLSKIKTEESLPERYLGVCTLHGVSLSPAAVEFVDMLRKHYNNSLLK